MGQLERRKKAQRAEGWDRMEERKKERNWQRKKWKIAVVGVVYLAFRGKSVHWPPMMLPMTDDVDIIYPIMRPPVIE